jgi:hypothetical protein
MKRGFLLMNTILAASVVAATSAAAQDAHEATLAGHAYLEADTFVPIPDDAPDALAVSAKFAGAGNTRTEQLESIETSSFMSADGVPRLTGADRPHVPANRFRASPVLSRPGTALTTSWPTTASATRRTHPTPC